MINGGTGVRMSSPSDTPAGEDPGRPLFLIANDLEIDFPTNHAIALLSGEEVQLSNCYIQGSKNGSGLYIGPGWNSEFMMTNSRVFGHMKGAGVEIAGGAHATLTNNIIGANANGVLVRSGVSDFILQGNHVGNIFKGSGQVLCVCVCVCAFDVCVYRVVPRACKLTLNLAGQCMLTCTIAMASCVILPRHALFFRRKTSQQYGIQVEAGDSDRYVITSNTLTGNQGVGLDDGGNGEHKAVANNIDGLSSQAP